jgi:hypothetical protein
MLEKNAACCCVKLKVKHTHDLLDKDSRIRFLEGEVERLNGLLGLK